MKKGFTLVEMMIVIAIIGILTSMVLVGLGGARDRARDARIQSNMNNLRLIAEMRYAADLNYDRVKIDDQSEIEKLSEDVFRNNGKERISIFRDPATKSQKYCASTPLKTEGYYFCVDSEGNAGKTTNSSPCVNVQCVSPLF